MNFVAPEGADNLNREVLFPLAEVQVPDYAANIAATVKQMDTFLQPGALTGNVEIDLVIDGQVTAGAKLFGKFTADDQGSKTVTLGDGFDPAAPAIVVPSAGTVFVTFAYDGTAFVPVASTVYVEALIAALDARITALEGA